MRYVIARKHVPRPSERLGKGARLTHLLGRHARRAIRREDVNDEELATSDSPGDAAATANERGSLRATANGHEDPLARRPRLLDTLLAAVLLETIVDLIGEPQKRELAKRREVPLAEELAERRIHGRGPIHLPLPQPHAQRIGAQVDQLDLLRFAQDRIGNRLVLHVARNVRDHVVEGLKVLNVHGRDDVDARIEQTVNILPALRRRILTVHGMSELVHENDVGLTLDNRRNIKLVIRRAAIAHPPRRNHRQPLKPRGGPRTPVGFNDAYDDVLPALQAVMGLLEHRAGLTYAGGSPQIHLEYTAHRVHVSPSPQAGRGSGH